MDIVLKFIEENFGLAFAVGVLIVGAVLSGVVWFTIWAVKVLTKNEKLENQINSLPCQEHKDVINMHAQQIGSASSLLNKISGQVELLVNLTVSSTAMPKPASASDYTKKASPRKLNTNGEKLYKDVKGDVFFQENEDFLLDEIGKLNPKTALDVENLSFAILRTHSDKDSFVGLKNWVYNAPVQALETEDGRVEKKEVSLDDVLYVLSIPLRDKYLAKHPEIKEE